MLLLLLTDASIESLTMHFDVCWEQGRFLHPAVLH